MFKRLAKGVSKRSGRRVVRTSIFAANLVLLVAVLWFVLGTSKTGQSTIQNSTIGVNNTAVNPLDEISSADIAANVARMTNVTEAISASNQADSTKVLLSISGVDETLVSKPQIINVGLKSIRDLKHYQTVPGDTIPKIAAKFGITSNSIKWSNSLTGDSISSGVWLWIPPVNGIVYVVRSGDTASSIAAKFSSNKEVIVAFNDAEISGLKVGQRIVVPNGRQAATAGGGGVSAAPGVLFLGGASGGYDYGWCTYYAAAKGGVPGGWGNANTWHIYAALSGWTVSTVPKVGAVAQSTAGWAGHVGIVEAVSSDGKMIKYSDMNGLAGFNRVGYSDWVPTIGKFERFIYH